LNEVLTVRTDDSSDLYGKSWLFKQSTIANEPSCSTEYFRRQNVRSVYLTLVQVIANTRYRHEHPTSNLPTDANITKTSSAVAAKDKKYGGNEEDEVDWDDSPLT